MKYDTLYDLDSKGKMRIWYLASNDIGFYTVSGLEDGKQVTSKTTVVKPKNIGKANETTIEQQTHLEILSKYEKKMKTGYVDVRENAGLNKPFFPMLAVGYTDKLISKVATEYGNSFAVQPKLDGIRCNMKVDGPYSRKNEKIPTMQFLWDDVFSEINKEHPTVIFDGELYNHDYKEKFQELTSVIGKKKPTKEHIQTAKEIVEYHVYGAYDSDQPDLNFKERQLLLITLLKKYHNHYNIKIVPTEYFDGCTKEEILNAADKYLDDKYEGGMIYNALAPYHVDKRSQTLMKRKPLFDGEYIVHDIIEGQGNWAGCAKSAVYKMSNGEFSSTGITGTEEEMRQILIDKDLFVGYPATVEYRGWTDLGKFRFGVTKKFWGKEGKI